MAVVLLLPRVEVVSLVVPLPGEVAASSAVELHLAEELVVGCSVVALLPPVVLSSGAARHHQAVEVCSAGAAVQLQGPVHRSLVEALEQALAHHPHLEEAPLQEAVCLEAVHLPLVGSLAVGLLHPVAERSAHLLVLVVQV